MATQLQTQDRSSAHPLVAFRSQLTTRAEEFKAALPSHISPEKFQRTAITAVQNDPELLNADRHSLLLAIMKAAQDGLLPDKREAALVIFKENKQINGQWQTRLLVQYMPMVYGLRKKILQSGEVRDISTAVVYRQEIEKGLFVYEEGTDRTLRHRPLLDPDFDPKDEDIALAYSIAIFNDGTPSFEVMRRSEINKVREKSQTGATRDKKGNPRTPSGPWVEWFSEQCRKTVLRRHSKSLPMSGDLVDVEAADDELNARSVQGALSAAEPTPPVLSVAPPMRGAVDDAPPALTAEPADMDASVVLHDSDGVLLDAAPNGPAPAEPLSNLLDANPQDEQDVYERILSEINRATSAKAVRTAVDSIPETMRDTWQSGLRDRAVERSEEIHNAKAAGR